jgi:hypothetical protein
MTGGALALTLAASIANAAPYREEHVTGGVLDLIWINGFDTSNNMAASTLVPSDPAYANPSGDHTVAVATSASTDSGGIIVTTIDAQGVNDYQWEGWIFTGDGNTRRGLLFRASPASNAKTFYMFVLESGMLRLRLRRLEAPAQVSTILGEWLTTSLPGGLPLLNTWHHMKVVATGPYTQVFWDGLDLTGGTPIVDPAPLLTGNVGCYNFRFDLGNVPVLFDDLLLSNLNPTPTTKSTWGAIKKLYH